MSSPRMMMPAPRITFGDLRRILEDLGFREVPSEESHVWFRHEEADLPLGFPRYRDEAVVAPHHLLYARTMIDARGILGEDEFDRMVLATSARPLAPR